MAKKKKKTQMKTLSDWAALGVCRVRSPNWIVPVDYMKLDLFGSNYGPWGHLYSPTQELLGLPTPQNMLVFGPMFDQDALWEKYEGPLHELDTGVKT